MSGSQGYVDDPPAAVDADSTNETNDSIIALLKAIKNLQIDLTELNVILAGAVSAGKVQCDTELTITGEGLATQATLADILAKILAAPSTEAKQDLILTALGLIATEATTGDIKTATEALAALISAGALAVSLTELPDTAAGDLADINTASASIDGKLPAIGQQLKAASLSIVPASDADDVKVTLDSESVAVTGPLTDTELRASDIKVTLDSESVAVTGPLTNAELTAQALATEATLGTMQADIALMKADLADILAILES